MTEFSESEIRRKIGQVTFYRTLYGAILQCVALQRFLRSEGFSYELIDYSTSGLLMNKSFVCRQISRISGALVKYVFCVRRGKNTECFVAKNIIRSRCYHSVEDLEADATEYSAYIVGSDQVWNPRNNNESPAYFLSFAPSGRPRIAYAPSFGIAQLSSGYEEKCREYLKAFDFLSAREKQGCELIQKLTGQNISQVLDPTFLVPATIWRSLKAPAKYPTGYVLCYQVGRDKTLRKRLDETAKMIAEKYGVRVIKVGQPGYMRMRHPFAEGWDAGPAEFLRLIDDATFIVTNSFHGLAFSLIFHKEFLIISRTSSNGLAASLDNRQMDLLHILELISRWRPYGESDIPPPIDYKKTEKILESERNKSRLFLLDALKNIEKY